MTCSILVGGFTNSGTSFLCNLIAEMGFSAGLPENLKAADAHNRWGYWEHEPLKKIVREAAGVRRGTIWWIDKLSDKQVLGRGHPAAKKVLEIAEADNVEVFKEGYLPLIYRLFPGTCRAVVIQRKKKALYERRGNKRQGLSYREFCKAFNYYYFLVERMSYEIPTLIVQYENFRTDFARELDRVVGFLRIDINNDGLVLLQRVFKPRKEKIRERIS